MVASGVVEVVRALVTQPENPTVSLLSCSIDQVHWASPKSSKRNWTPPLSGSDSKKFVDALHLAHCSTFC